MRTKWRCPLCIHTSTRHWNMEVHIKRRHRGAGYPIELNVSHSDSEFVPDNPYGQYAKGYYPYPNTSSAPRQEKREALSKKKSDRFDEISEMIRKTVEWAHPFVEWKNMVNQFWPASLSSINTDDILLGGTRTPPFIERPFLQKNFTLTTDPLRDQVVAYRGIVCEYCLVSLSLPIYKLKETGTKVEAKHSCNSEDIEKRKALAEKEKQNTIHDLYKNLPEVVKEVVIQWTNKTINLIAYKLTDIQKGSIDLVTTNPNDLDHWTTRATREGQTILDDNELMQFLKAGNITQTFKYFHLNLIQQGVSTSYSYLMYISKDPVDLGGQ
jgi:hypothetical protein